MAEQTGQQATGIKGVHSDQRDSFGRSKLYVIHQERFPARLHQDRRHDARLPSHDASWAGHTTAHPGIQQAALGQQPHRPLAAEVHPCPHLTSPAVRQAVHHHPRLTGRFFTSHSRDAASSGTPSPAADRTLLHITQQRRRIKRYTIARG